MHSILRRSVRNRPALAVLVFVFAFVALFSRVSVAYAYDLQSEQSNVIKIAQVDAVTSANLQAASGRKLGNFLTGLLGKGKSLLTGKTAKAAAAAAGVSLLTSAAGAVSGLAMNMYVVVWGVEAISAAVQKMVGNLVLWSFSTFIIVVGYNDFLDNAFVNSGWTVVLNTTNLFLVLILLVIAFATVFRIQTYQYQKLLPKFVLAVFLVNFSRTIVGFAIDIAQNVMLLFATAMSGSASGNFIKLLKVDEWLQVAPLLSGALTEGLKEGAGNFLTFLAPTGLIERWITAMFTISISVFVLGIALTLLFTVVFRIIIIWMLIILSPVAFMLSILPATQKYFSQWLDMLVKQLTVGPLLVFFVWLALFAVQQDSSVFSLLDQPSIDKYLTSLGGTKDAALGKIYTDTNLASNTGTAVAGTAVSTWKNLANFFVAALVLVAGIKFSAQMSGGFGAAAAGKVVGGVNAGIGKAKGFVSKVGSKAQKFGSDAGKYAGKSLSTRVAGMNKSGQNWKQLGQARSEANKEALGDLPLIGDVFKGDDRLKQEKKDALNTYKLGKAGLSDPAAGGRKAAAALVKDKQKDYENYSKEELDTMLDTRGAAPSTIAPGAKADDIEKYVDYRALEEQWKSKVRADADKKADADVTINAHDSGRRGRTFKNDFADTANRGSGTPNPAGPPTGAAAGPTGSGGGSSSAPPTGAAAGPSSAAAPAAAGAAGGSSRYRRGTNLGARAARGRGKAPTPDSASSAAATDRATKQVSDDLTSAISGASGGGASPEAIASAVAGAIGGKTGSTDIGAALKDPALAKMIGTSMTPAIVKQLRSAVDKSISSKDITGKKGAPRSEEKPGAREAAIEAKLKPIMKAINDKNPKVIQKVMADAPTMPDKADQDFFGNLNKLV